MFYDVCLVNDANSLDYVWLYTANIEPLANGTHLQLVVTGISRFIDKRNLTLLPHNVAVITLPLFEFNNVVASFTA